MATAGIRRSLGAVRRHGFGVILSAGSLRRFFPNAEGADHPGGAGLAIIGALPKAGRRSFPESRRLSARRCSSTRRFPRAKRAVGLPDVRCLTGLFVGMILTPHEPWYVEAITAAVGVGSKYLVRAAKRPTSSIPPALALVATFYPFHTRAELVGCVAGFAAARLLLIGAGAFVADRIRKLRACSPSSAASTRWLRPAAFFGDPRSVAELYRTPDLQVALILRLLHGDRSADVADQSRAIRSSTASSPPSPATPRSRMIGAADFLLDGVLVANIWEAVRRHQLLRGGSRTVGRKCRVVSASRELGGE